MSSRGTPLNTLYDPIFKGPSTHVQNKGWFGRTTVPSGSVSATVSTALVNSDSVIRIGTQPTSVGAAAQSGGPIVVNSIVSGTSFAFARAYGTAVGWDETVMWEIVGVAN